MGLCVYANRFPALAEGLEEIKELVLLMAVPFLVKRTLVECESGCEPRATELRWLRPIETWGGVMWGVTLAESLQAVGEGLGGSGRISAVNCALTPTLNVTKVSARQRRL